jgi:hypothetical protein
MHAEGMQHNWCEGVDSKICSPCRTSTRTFMYAPPTRMMHTRMAEKRRALQPYRANICIRVHTAHAKTLPARAPRLSGNGCGAWPAPPAPTPEASNAACTEEKIRVHMQPATSKGLARGRSSTPLAREEENAWLRLPTLTRHSHRRRRHTRRRHRSRPSIAARHRTQARAPTTPPPLQAARTVQASLLLSFWDEVYSLLYPAKSVMSNFLS